jgi:prefoldin beta subunit
MADKVGQLQLAQQNLHNITHQKQQVESQLVELQSAQDQLQTTEKSYKILGKIMLAVNKETLIKDVTEKKEVLEIRFKNLIKQEENLQQNINELQQEVMKEMKNES